MKKFLAFIALSMSFAVCAAAPPTMAAPALASCEQTIFVEPAQACYQAAEVAQVAAIRIEAARSVAFTHAPASVCLNDLQHFYRPIEYEILSTCRYVIVCTGYKRYKIIARADVPVPRHKAKGSF